MNEIHVGRGTTRGAITVFPLWGTTTGFSRYTTDAAHLDVSECDAGPTVSTLMVGNTGDEPVLVLEGQLFEGGWQHRMACGSSMVGVRQRMPIEVACVERGRWTGGTRQHSRGRRATPYIRDAVRRHDGGVQGEVWSRVARHTAGTDNATESFVRHLDGAEAVDLSAFRRLPGQVGVLVGVGGQPYAAEVFDSQSTLRRQFGAIIAAAALDARFAPAVPTPGRRARRFVERVEQLRIEPTAVAGIAERTIGRSDRVDAAGLRWQGRDVHLRLTNVRHPLLVHA